MTDKRFNVIPRLMMSLFLCLQMPVAASAADQIAELLQPEAPSIDTTPPDKQVKQLARTTTTLNGSIDKNESMPGDSPAQTQNSQEKTQTADSPTNLQTETGNPGATAPYALALKKLAARAELTSDDYRSLGIGVLGMETVRTFFQNEAKVEELYADLPAQQAGIKLGDRWIDPDADKDDAKVEDPTRPVWMFSCGIAGQPVDITLKRHGQLLSFHLIRMNMEDIQDVKLRRTYEQLVQRLGAPEGRTEVPPQTASAPSKVFSPTWILKSLIGL